MVGKMMSLMKLKKFVKKLRWCMKVLQLQPIRTIPSNEELVEILGQKAALPPKGHFAVLAGKGDDEEAELRKFVVELRFLRNPTLLKLLKEAEEEYGFQQEGALVVPCKPEELKKILLEDKF
ncbi:auxin-responsive protein SAUR32-like [Chenopodium quinoa]|nr:auxin-responsive protein SAUR32-like [Chenopodium quinoa]